MNITFRSIERRDFQAVRELGLKGWYFAYSHLKKQDLKELVEKY